MKKYFEKKYFEKIFICPKGHIFEHTGDGSVHKSSLHHIIVHELSTRYVQFEYIQLFTLTKNAL